jgi:hypothetical protein
MEWHHAEFARNIGAWHLGTKRSRVDMKCSCVALAIVCCLIGLMDTPIASAIDIGTTTSYQRQRFEAWGTSLAWMGNEIGGWSPTGPREQLMDLLFGADNQLGLNFVRYNIGAGQNPSLSIPRPGADMDGWIPDAPTSITDSSTWQWDWNADATQRWMLDEALARGVTQVEAFANSAPWWMTISQDSTGAPNNNQSNLAQSHFDEYSYYLAEVVEHFENNLGIHFNTLAPMNEPGAGWWTSPGNQEGMNIPMGQNQALLIQAAWNEIQNRSLDIHLVGPEETSATDTIESWQNPAYNAAIKSYIHQINTHTYPYNGGSSSAVLTQLQGIAQADGKKVFASEFGIGNENGLNGGIGLANQISRDLKDLQAIGWTYWQAVENNNGSGWGLIIAPFTGATETFFMRKQYQVMHQFTSYVRPGSQILQVTDEETVAAYDPYTDTTAIVFTNDESTSDTNTYALLDKPAAYTRLIRTTSSENFMSLGPATLNGSTISVTGPGSSVSTIVIHHQPNRIQNAGFNLGGQADGSQGISGWQVQGGAFYGFGGNSNDGSGSGVLWADNPANSGSAFQTGIGDSDTDLTGVAFEFSIDVRFQNAGAAHYDADMYLSLEFYGADDQTLAHDSASTYRTLIEPAIGIDTTVATDSDYRTYRTSRFVAPPGTRYVRPVFSYESVQAGSNQWVYFDNAYLQQAHPTPDGQEWNISGSGSWSDEDNWLGHAVVSRNNSFYFGPAIKQASVINVDFAEDVTELTFFGEHQYHLQGVGSLGFGDLNSASLIDVRRGSHRISVATTLGGGLHLQALPGASLTFDSTFDLNGMVLTKLGAGELELQSGFEMNGGQIESYLTPSATIKVGADAVLDGSLKLLASPGQSLGNGDVFELISYTSLFDTFDDIILPSLPTGLAWSLEYGPDSLMAEVVELLLQGDFDADGDVDDDDLLQWQGDYRVNGNSDADGDGDSDGRDFLIWQRNFGMSVPAATVVPEPSSFAMISFILMALGISRENPLN